MFDKRGAFKRSWLLCANRVYLHNLTCKVALGAVMSDGDHKAPCANTEIKISRFYKLLRIKKKPL